VRILLVGWLLLMVTLAAIAVSADWYQYRSPTQVRGTAAYETALAEGWEPVPGRTETLLFYRRARLRLW